MKIISVEKNNWKKELQNIVTALQKGAVVVFPTETAYGIGGDARNKKVINRINSIKKRSSKKFLPCIASSVSVVLDYFYASNEEREYIKNKWPGPFTLLLRPKLKSKGLKFGYDDVAVRVSGSEVARYLARKLGGFIISTSANLSGAQTNYSAQKIYKEFENRKEQPDFIIDWGVLPKRATSSIVKFEQGEKIKIR